MIDNCGARPSLGRLDPVDPRAVWPHEAHNFTPWLLDNVDVLNDLLGMDLVLDQAEHRVGSFSLDLIGTDQANGERVIVENQLEVSDHTHLGQIITYAAGTDPTTIVWITAGFKPEHRAAIDWLNQRTDDSTRIFGVVIHVVRIGDSAVAPNFELVVQPNDWEKQVKKTVVSNQTSRPYREFWEEALAAMRGAHPGWTSARTSASSWINTPTGTSGVVYSTAWYSSGLVTQIYFEHRDAAINAARFEAIQDRREVFEVALGAPARWDPMEGRKAARIALDAPEVALDDRSSWPTAISWILESQRSFRRAVDAIGGLPDVV